MEIDAKIEQPTLLINEEIARRNIRLMALKIRRAGVSFRPHFKTHQSAEIGDWFRPEGIEKITVSSVDMAEYFADHGWDDILIAFPVNIRQMDRIAALAKRIHLCLLIENHEAVEALAKHGGINADIWIKVDAGYHRTGIPWQNTQVVADLIGAVTSLEGLHFRGLLTHSGNTYHCHGKAEVSQTFREGVGRMNLLKTALAGRGISGVEISVGDTPGCTLCDDLSGIDELRPGNFIFYDAQQLEVGDCQSQQVAVAVACPVVAIHPERREVTIYGGAIHLSKDTLEVGGVASYGLVAFADGRGWVSPVEGAIVKSLSQEHGILRFADGEYSKLKIGDLVYILPAHSCLTVQVLRKYLSLDGRVINTMN